MRCASEFGGSNLCQFSNTLTSSVNSTQVDGRWCAESESSVCDRRRMCKNDQVRSNSAAKLLSCAWQASLWTVDGWPLAHPLLTSGGLDDTQAASGRDACSRRLLRRHRSLSTPKSRDGGAAAAEAAAGTVVGAEGRAKRRLRAVP